MKKKKQQQNEKPTKTTKRNTVVVVCCSLSILSHSLSRFLFLTVLRSTVFTSIHLSWIFSHTLFGASCACVLYVLFSLALALFGCLFELSGTGVRSNSFSYWQLFPLYGCVYTPVVSLNVFCALHFSYWNHTHVFLCHHQRRISFVFRTQRPERVRGTVWETIHIDFRNTFTVSVHWSWSIAKLWILLVCYCFEYIYQEERNSTFNTYFVSLQITLFHKLIAFSCAIFERFIRKKKERIWRFKIKYAERFYSWVLFNVCGLK